MAFTYKFGTLGPKKWLIVYDNGTQIYSGTPSFAATNDILVQEAILGLKDSYPGVENMTQIKTESSTTKSTTITPPVKTPANSGVTFNTVQTSELIDSKDKLKEKILLEIEEISIKPPCNY